MENNKYVVFIITHGRPDNVYTYDTLIKYNYTGEIYLILDDEDNTADMYIKKFGEERVKIFNKKSIADLTDEGNNFNNRRTTTHARNACFDIAMDLGYTYFLVLDDDYTLFRYRYIDKYITKGRVNNLDNLFQKTFNYYAKCNFLSIAFAQGGDFIGGENCGLLKNYLYNSRKCMNSFFCSVDRRFWFLGQLNEDVNTYVTLGSRGNLFMTIPFVGLEQKPTQLTKGGMTESYLKYGTYAKSFSTVMMQPSSVFVAMMGFTQNRLHHRVIQRRTTPMIIDETYKKQ